MIGTPKFWIFMVVFQVAFGLAVFAITRQAYMPVADDGHAVPTSTVQESDEWSTRIAQISPAPLGAPGTSVSVTRDPAEMSRLANEYFANQQYAQAAELYEGLLAFGTNSAETHNNLGITLHYIGRSADAVATLNEGISIDPSYQRIWLTLGYVNSQTGNIEEARTALTTAVELGAGNNVGQSAQKMLSELP